MSVFSSQIRHKPWLTQVTILSTVMGALLALSLKTQDKIRGQQLGDASLRPNKLAAAYAELRDENEKGRRQIAMLQKRLQEYQETDASDSNKAKLLAGDLKRANVLAGLTPVSGPGVEVVLRDSKKTPARPNGISDDDWSQVTQEFIIHDRDIRDVINELRASGAEAIAVNDQRVVATTSVRCVGPVVQVNGVATAGSPVRIKAIGDPDAMVSGLMMPRGVLDGFKTTDPAMFQVDKIKSQTMPAYAGGTSLRFAREAPDDAAAAAQRQSEESARSGGAALTGGAAPGVSR